jgi:hypothetical protein
MARVCTTSAIFVVVVLGGCGTTPVTSPPPPVVNSAVVGKWAVTSIDGKPVPSGTEINLVYHSDGKVSVETTGDATGVPKMDREELKQALDQIAAPRANVLHKLDITVGATKFQLSWNGGERDVPKAPAPPK